MLHLWVFKMSLPYLPEYKMTLRRTLNETCLQRENVFVQIQDDPPAQ